MKARNHVNEICQINTSLSKLDFYFTTNHKQQPRSKQLTNDWLSAGLDKQTMDMWMTSRLAAIVLYYYTAQLEYLNNVEPQPWPKSVQTLVGPANFGSTAINEPETVAAVFV